MWLKYYVMLTESMHPDLKAALEAPNRKLQLARALEYAELEIRKYIWRGQKSPVSLSDKAVMGDSATAEDFVAEALKRMVHGKRKYEPNVDLFQNLKSIIRSLVNAHKKTSDRNPLVDRGGASDEEEFDPTLLISDLDSTPAHEVLDGKERRAAAKGWREDLRNSLKDKPELLALEDAMFNEYTDCAEIATLCDCTVERIYVLNRALKKHTIAFFGVQTTTELARKTMESHER